MRNKETFILSLWVKEGKRIVLRGMLQNVKNGERQPFANTKQLLALLRAGYQQSGTISNENDVIARRDD